MTHQRNSFLLTSSQQLLSLGHRHLKLKQHSQPQLVRCFALELQGYKNAVRCVNLGTKFHTTLSRKSEATLDCVFFENPHVFIDPKVLPLTALTDLLTHILCCASITLHKMCI